MSAAAGRVAWPPDAAIPVAPGPRSSEPGKPRSGASSILRDHLVERGRGLLLVDRQARRQRQVRAGVLHRPRPAFLNPAARSHRPGTGRGPQRLVVQHAGGGIVEDRGVAAPLPGIRFHARLVEIVERAELAGRHHPPARGSGRIGAAEMGAGSKRAVRAVVMRPDGIAVSGTPRVRPLQDPDAAFEQAGEEGGAVGAVIGRSGSGLRQSAARSGMACHESGQRYRCDGEQRGWKPCHRHVPLAVFAPAARGPAGSVQHAARRRTMAA